MGLSIVERVKTVALPMGPLTNFGYYTPKAVRSRQSFAMYFNEGIHFSDGGKIKLKVKLLKI